VVITLLDGSRLTGRILAVGRYAVVAAAAGDNTRMVFKHALASVERIESSD
jgi:sRNA-binding regulator protein Hfq